MLSFCFLVLPHCGKESPMVQKFYLNLRLWIRWTTLLHEVLAILNMLTIIAIDSSMSSLMSLLSIPFSANSAYAASVNTSEIFCCISTGLRFSGASSVLSLEQCKTYLELTLALHWHEKNPTFLWSAFSHAVWITTICFAVVSDERTFWLPCLKNLFSHR